MIRLLAALLLLPTITQAATCDAVNGSNPNLTIGAVTPLTLVNSPRRTAARRRRRCASTRRAGPGRSPQR